jgi:uncharacterized SAM-binding protein YcdF (DUF218 family)
LLFVLALAAVAATFFFAGVIVDHVDPIAPADVIYVLGGSRIERALEAADLYADHVAPKILISEGAREGVENTLRRRGIHVPTEGEGARDTLVAHFNIPASAIEILADDVDNTAQEAETLGSRAVTEHWKRLIVITDCATTRRAGFVFRSVLPTVDIVARCSRHDNYDPWRWWRRRSTFRETFYEFPKLLAYWAGLRG